ncbi:hypothetical protein YC2023_045188 [Brassica napus]
MSTPPHIVPEWYFLPIHAIIRSIPDKAGGVAAIAPFKFSTDSPRNVLVAFGGLLTTRLDRMSTCGSTICYYWTNFSFGFLLVLCHNAHSGTTILASGIRDLSILESKLQAQDLICDLLLREPNLK